MHVKIIVYSDVPIIFHIFFFFLNREIFRLVGLWQDWSIVFMTVAAVLASYCLLLLVCVFC